MRKWFNVFAVGSATRVQAVPMVLELAQTRRVLAANVRLAMPGPWEPLGQKMQRAQHAIRVVLLRKQDRHHVMPALWAWRLLSLGALRLSNAAPRVLLADFTGIHWGDISLAISSCSGPSSAWTQPQNTFPATGF